MSSDEGHSFQVHFIYFCNSKVLYALSREKLGWSWLGSSGKGWLINAIVWFIGMRIGLLSHQMNSFNKPWRSVFTSKTFWEKGVFLCVLHTWMPKMVLVLKETSASFPSFTYCHNVWMHSLGLFHDLAPKRCVCMKACFVSNGVRGYKQLLLLFLCFLDYLMWFKDSKSSSVFRQRASLYRFYFGSVRSHLILILTVQDMNSAFY